MHEVAGVRMNEWGREVRVGFDVGGTRRIIMISNDTRSRASEERGIDRGSSGACWSSVSQNGELGSSEVGLYEQEGYTTELGSWELGTRPYRGDASEVSPKARDGEDRDDGAAAEGRRYEGKPEALKRIHEKNCRKSECAPRLV
jgi:hypothetical protein